MRNTIFVARDFNPQKKTLNKQQLPPQYKTPSQPFSPSVKLQNCDIERLNLTVRSFLFAIAHCYAVLLSIKRF